MKHQEDNQGTLYIVATPIGNLKDMTLRAIETLQQVDLIAAEDTRHSRPLLHHYAVDTAMISLHQHNEQQRAQKLLQQLQAGKDVALISDAGTPSISDPGSRLVAHVAAAGISVVPVPGACAITSALCASGLTCDQFMFEGFLPAKGERREKALQALMDETRTVVLYESVHRINNLLELLQRYVAADRQIVVARELTKRYETILRGSVVDVKTAFDQNAEHCRGEFVVLIEKAAPTMDNDATKEQQRVLQILLQECSLKSASRLTAAITGGARNVLYDMAITLQKQE
jgi:16S rRNA (cytidine1402-2'-O)-methyltransferase